MSNGVFYRMESQKQVMLLDLKDEIIINSLIFHIVFHQLKMQYVGNIVSEYGRNNFPVISQRFFNKRSGDML